ncbi:MAG: hypothetical protein ACE5HO_13425 [bacterium]
MAAQLTISERRYLDEFLKSINETETSRKFSFFYSGVISILGLILFLGAVIITLNNLNDRVVYWVFLPGSIGGIGIVLLGIFLLKYLKKVQEKKKLATIIKKLLN